MLATMFALFVPPAHAVSLVLVIGDSCVVSRVDSILIHVGFKGKLVIGEYVAGSPKRGWSCVS